MTTTDKLIAITGNTYPVKEALKALGARWNGDRKAWMVAPEKAEEAQAIVAGAGPAKARSFGARSGSAPTKRCWECGCSFTYGQAKANDGDWQDSYCGC